MEQASTEGRHYQLPAIRHTNKRPEELQRSCKIPRWHNKNARELQGLLDLLLFAGVQPLNSTHQAKYC